jgi:sec-independent protein translocase protein TatB
MSFSDTAFLFFLVLILFGPKKLPEIARQAGRLLAELRRASNEFRSQVETEIAHLEVQKNEVQKNQTVVPTSPPPRDTLTTLSPPALGESIPREGASQATLDAPAVAVPAASSDATLAPSTPASPEAPADTAASQESHV